MNRNYCLFFILLVTFLQHESILAQRVEKVRKEMEELLVAQSSAWNQGNVEDFMKTYWDDENLLFLSKNGPTFGYRNTLENYYKRYPDRDAMGYLTFEIVRLDKRSRSVYSLVGKYHLNRDKMDNLSGFFLLIIKKIKGDWKIVADSTH
ncbi:MAG: DUF4440 domain-containing protein [Saprospiraceae bacterium]|nr:DUF4440 domain-containing protein [Saprospiraceae bacterium]